MFAHATAQPIIELIERMRAAVGKPKRDFEREEARRGGRRARRGPVDKGILESSLIKDKKLALRRLQEGQGGHGRAPSRRSSAPRSSPSTRSSSRPSSTSESTRSSATTSSRENKRIDGRDMKTIRPIATRGRHFPARPRLGALPARRDAGHRHDDPRHVERRAEDRRVDRRAVEALPAPLQLPSLLDRRDQAHARPRAARDRPRSPRRAGAPLA